MAATAASSSSRRNGRSSNSNTNSRQCLSYWLSHSLTLFLSLSHAYSHKRAHTHAHTSAYTHPRRRRSAEAAHFVFHLFYMGWLANTLLCICARFRAQAKITYRCSIYYIYTYIFISISYLWMRDIGVRDNSSECTAIRQRRWRQCLGLIYINRICI